MKKISFQGFIKDLVPVLLGVLIALYINNLNEDYKNKKYIENFYTSLQQELKETHKDFIEKKPIQKQLLDTLNYYANNNTLPLIDVIMKGGGINGTRIKLNYWKSLANSKIELISYDKLSILADIEEGKELLTYKRNKILDFVYANLRETSSDKKIILKLMMEEVLRTQENIMEDILKIINEGKPQIKT